MAITLRNVKGTELSHAEMDTNFESFYYSSSLSGNTLSLHTTGSNTHSIDLSSIIPATPTLQQVTTQGATTTNDIEVSGSLDVTGSFSAIGQSTLTSLNSLSSPLVIEPGLGSSFGSVYMKTYATAGTIAEFNQTAISINSSYTLGSLKFSKQTSTWGLIKVQATNTNQKSVISLTANSTSTPHIEIDGENDEITLKNKVLAPDLANTSKPYVIGFDSATGELTYFTTSSFGSGGGGSIDTGSFYLSSSVSLNTITFTRGDGTTESVTVDTGSGGSSATPGGSDTYVQFNDGGSTFGGDSGLTYNKTANRLTITAPSSPSRTAPNLLLNSELSNVTAGEVLGVIAANNTTDQYNPANYPASIQFVADINYSPGVYDTGIRFYTNDGAVEKETLRLINTGQNRLPQYGSGTFTGTATKYLAVDSSGNVIEEDAPSSGSTDYVSNVTVSGDDLSFTGQGSAFNTTVDISSIAGEIKSKRASVNSPDDIAYTVDSNTTEVVIGDSTPAGSSTIDEINGRTILIDQSNTINGTLRFGFASWTGQASSDITAKQTFECTGYNIGQDDFDIGVYLPQGTWDIYQIGHQSGGADRVAEYQTGVSIGASGAPRYFTRSIIEGAKFEVYYNYFHKKVLVWCSAWTGTGGATGAVTFSAADPN